MRVKLYEKLKNKKDLLKSLLNLSSGDENIKNRVKDQWLSYAPSHRDNFSVVVSDGSLSVRQYLGFYLVVFSGYGYFYSLKTKENADCDVGDIIVSVAKKPEVAKSYASLLMFLSELKTIYNILKQKNPDIIIFDGTITSRLITPFPRSEWFTKSAELNSVLNSVSVDVINLFGRKFLDFNEVFCLSQEVDGAITKAISEKGYNPRQDIKEAVVSKLAYYEMMLTLSELFKKSSSTIVGLAKTSSGTDIFREVMPDIKLFSKYADTLGYSKEKVPQDITKLKSSFGEVLGEVSLFLSELDVQAFYAKYSTPRVVNLIEFYQNPNRASVDVKDIVDMLASISIDGYPFLLKKVDNEVRITGGDIEFVERELGLEKAITGRENL